MNPAVPLVWRLRALQASLLLPPLVRLVSLGRLSAWLGRIGPPDPGLDDRALAAWVDRLLYAAPPPWRRTCLTRGTVMFHLLRRAGRPVELKIGVRRDGARNLAAHAWLVLHGAPYLEAEDHPSQAFADIATFPERA